MHNVLVGLARVLVRMLCCLGTSAVVESRACTSGPSIQRGRFTYCAPRMDVKLAPHVFQFFLKLYQYFENNKKDLKNHF